MKWFVPWEGQIMASPNTESELQLLRYRLDAVERQLAEITAHSIYRQLNIIPAKLVCELLDISMPTLKNWVVKGRIGFFSIGNKKFVELSSLRDFIYRHRTRTIEELRQDM